MSYTTEVPEEKSDRERYIRVPAIDMMTIAGCRHICGVWVRLLHHNNKERTRLSGSGIHGRIEFSSPSFVGKKQHHRSNS